MNPLADTSTEEGTAEALEQETASWNRPKAFQNLELVDTIRLPDSGQVAELYKPLGKHFRAAAMQTPSQQDPSGVTTQFMLLSQVVLVDGEQATFDVIENLPWTDIQAMNEVLFEEEESEGPLASSIASSS